MTLAVDSETQRLIDRHLGLSGSEPFIQTERLMETLIAHAEDEREATEAFLCRHIAERLAQLAGAAIAVPEMLAALRDALDKLDRCENLHKVLGLRGTIDRVSNAIAKAEGRS